MNPVIDKMSLSRSLYGERGLKYQELRPLSTPGERRSLYGERGLKSYRSKEADKSFVVAPFTGSVD